MRWIHRHEYVNVETGETTKSVDKPITIIKSKIKYEYYNTSTRIVKHTNYYRDGKWEQLTIHLPQKGG